MPMLKHVSPRRVMVAVPVLLASVAFVAAVATLGTHRGGGAGPRLGGGGAGQRSVTLAGTSPAVAASKPSGSGHGSSASGSPLVASLPGVVTPSGGTRALATAGSPAPATAPSALAPTPAGSSVP